MGKKKDFYSFTHYIVHNVVLFRVYFRLIYFCIFYRGAEIKFGAFVCWNFVL